MTDPSNPAVRDRLDPALRDALDRADRLDEVAVLYDPVAALLEAYGLEERLAVVAVVSGGPSARIAALEAGALEALGPDLDPREAVLRLEMAIARFRSRLVLETAREHLGAQAQAVERDLRLAAQMQRSFLPQELPTDGVSVATAYLPREFTSGDTYDVRVLGDGRLALYTLDAVGHDVRAALLTVLLRSALRARGGDPSHEPHAMVQAANEALLAANLEESPTAAICYAILEPKTGALRYAAAGHPPPLVLRKGAAGSG